MTNKKLNFLLFITVLILVTACNTALPQTEPTSVFTQPVISTLELPQGQTNIPQTEDEVPRVTVEEARIALDSGLAVIVDVRNADAYAASHADGAISIPLNAFESNIDGIALDKDQWIITYCT